MSRSSLINIVFIIFWSQSLAADKPENIPAPVYDAQLSTYQYGFDVNYFSIESQHQTLNMAYIFL